MANVRDSDTSLWLHNKLGTSNDSWTGGSICSQLNSEVLRNIKECFPDLQTQVKLKLLLSFFQIPQKNVQEWRMELEEILELAQVDSDRWVSVLAEIMRTFPNTYSLNADFLEIKENKRIFDELLHDLKKQLKKPTDFSMLPMECHYLNKSALVNVIGQPPVPKKHFTLKRKPKSAAVKADLMQKSVDIANNMKKNISPAVPVRSRGMPRKMTDTTPLKGIPSRLPSSGFRTSILSTNSNRPTPNRPLSGRKDCAIKLLDITEQPLGYAQAKKRKRMLEMEESKRALEDSQNASFNGNDTLNGENGNPPSVDSMQPPPTPATPDYAAGLTSLNPPTPSVVISNNRSPIHTPSQAPSTPYTQPVTPYFQPTSVLQSPRTPKTPSYTPVIMDSSTIKEEKAAANNVTSPIKQELQVQPQQSQPIQEQPQVQPQPQVVKTTPTVTTIPRVTTQSKSQMVSVAISSRDATLPLNLPKEQLAEAQEMFKNANKVTTPEKILILSFMAGSRENPCPQLGNIMTIKLSENRVSIQQPDGTYRTYNVEMHFQMNYNTGKWNWIEKRREIDPGTSLSSLAAVAAAAANNEQFPSQQQQLTS
ncbi:negative elongation factor A-like [Planococcus citri]|uniref:negative elongation factor A-like n=1 Tax=Planococcus citri TaxID=170843 RepID=UPI0031F72481